jgi:cytochrome-b5 reductase
MAHGNYFYADYVNLVAGGTGITPMYQIITAMLSKESKKITAKLALLYANRNESDILLKAEFDALADKYPDSFKLFYVISNTPEDADWRYGEGHVSVHSECDTEYFRSA